MREYSGLKTVHHKAETAPFSKGGKKKKKLLLGYSEAACCHPLILFCKLVT